MQSDIHYRESEKLWLKITNYNYGDIFPGTKFSLYHVTSDISNGIGPTEFA